MSVVKQILLSIVVLAIAGGLWFAYDRNMIPFLPNKPATTPGGGGGFPGGPPGGFAGGFPGAPGGAGANARAPAPIIAAAVTADDDGFEVRAIGTVAANQAITIYPQVTGIVSEIGFSPGMPVKAGQALFHLTNSDEQVALQKAKVALDSAQAAFDRSSQLAKANTVTAAALNDAQTTLTNAQIGYQTAQLALDKKTVAAPFAGTTGLSTVTVGDLVTSNKALTTLDDLSTVAVSFDVPERASGRVAVGQEVAATTSALTGKNFTGMISAVDSRVDPTARTLRVEAKLPNDANSLKPGMAVTITMAFPGEMHPVVPSLSIQYDRNGAYVWKVDNGVVHRVGVDVIDRRSGTVIVTASLKPGDLVASEGLQRLRENARVNVVDDGSGGAPGATQPAAPVASAVPEPVTPPANGAPAGAGAGGPGANRPQGAGGAGAGGNRPAGAGAGGPGAAAGAGAGGAGAAAGAAGGGAGAAAGANGFAGRQRGQGQGGAPQGAGPGTTGAPAGAGAPAAPAAAPATAAAAGPQNG
jgi:RND family efflux transporter MFP subunit